MTRRFRLGTVLRARQAQEGAAKAAVMSARADAARAAEEAMEMDQAIDHAIVASAVPSIAAARGLVTALTIRRARAESAARAYQAAGDAEHVVGERIGEWSAAAVQHRMVEKLAERHLAEVRRADVAVDQLLVDELATTSSARRATKESRP